MVLLACLAISIDLLSLLLCLLFCLVLSLLLSSLCSLYLYCSLYLCPLKTHSPVHVHTTLDPNPSIMPSSVPLLSLISQSICTDENCNCSIRTCNILSLSFVSHRLPHYCLHTCSLTLLLFVFVSPLSSLVYAKRQQ